MRVGILGGGQLGQMLTLAGYPIGIKTTCFDKSLDVPAALVGTVIPGEITDTQKLRRWASHVDVITYEIENFPAELVSDLAEVRPVHPSPKVLAAAQDRFAEKRLFNELEIPVSPFRLLEKEADLHAALDDLEGPIVVKSRMGGYDGRGQVIVRNQDDIKPGLHLMSQTECVAEQWVSFSTELSIIGVRGTDGDIALYPVTENEHRNGILHASMAPAHVSPQTQQHAEHYITLLLNHLDYVGVLALEMFSMNGRLIANEMAPRVHNSGHWTIEGAETSQFENHLRAVSGLPLGSTQTRFPTAMINLIGAIPNIDSILAVPGAHLHLYGKDARPGRKLGHVTVTADSEEQLRKRLVEIENLVRNRLSE